MMSNLELIICKYVLTCANVELGTDHIHVEGEGENDY